MASMASVILIVSDASTAVLYGEAAVSFTLYVSVYAVSVYAIIVRAGGRTVFFWLYDRKVFSFVMTMIHMNHDLCVAEQLFALVQNNNCLEIMLLVQGPHVA